MRVWVFNIINDFYGLMRENVKGLVNLLFPVEIVGVSKKIKIEKDTGEAGEENSNLNIEISFFYNFPTDQYYGGYCERVESEDISWPMASPQAQKKT
jgi:hypothetical protein